MKFAVLPVTVSNRARGTTFNRQWIERVCDSVKRYYEDQSGSRVSLSFTVFDWFALPITFEQWMALGGNVSDTVNPMISSNAGGFAPQNINLTGFDRFIYIIDDGASGGGVTENNETRIAASDFDPAILAHEIGHIFGPDDTFLQTDTGRARYLSYFCVMGMEGAKYSFKDTGLVSLADGAEIDRVDCGPGMCVASLLRTGWLNLSHGVKIDSITTSWVNNTVRIRALDGAPDSPVVSPVFAWFDDGERYLVEYRRANSRWDRGLPPAPNGWLVVYRTPIDQPAEALEVASFPVNTGTTVAVDAAPDIFYLFGASPLRIGVLSCDPASGSIEIYAKRRKGKPPQYEVPFPEIPWTDRSVLWTPNTGWRTLPVGSDLAKVLEQVGELDEVQELARAAPAHLSKTWSGMAAHHVESVQQSLNAFGASLATMHVATTQATSISSKARSRPEAILREAS